MYDGLTCPWCYLGFDDSDDVVRPDGTDYWHAECV